MPVLPLFDTPADPNASHRVTAPGGYERWHFDAEDESGRLRFVAAFHAGPGFHAEYLRRYRRYRRRPTRVPPPQPHEYPCVAFSVYEGGQVLGDFATLYRQEEFSASQDRPLVRVGPNTFAREPDGTLRLELRQGLSADLFFHPLFQHAPLQRRLVSPGATAGEHHWVVAAPLCRVEGTIRSGTGATGARELSFVGRGYHDHHYGTAPAGADWARGRVLADERVLAFHVAPSPSPAAADAALAVEGDAAGLRDLADGSCVADWGRTRSRLAHPARIEFKGGARLGNPRILHATPHCRRILYEVSDGGGSVSALCEFACA
jgi:hypothetical protein